MPALNLSAAQWRQALALLDQALTLPPSQHAGWLAALPEDQQALRPALQQLLADRAPMEQRGFLARLPTLADDGTPGGSARPDQTPTGDRDDGLRSGQLLGPWRLLRPLGQGGMASVWLAERADGAHRRPVALKLPFRHAPGARAAATLAERFLRERAILSTLDHPHIAQVLDAGLADGQPWLAMAFVDGLPITDHATRHALDVPARLRLFLQVLQAAQHAHARLVIHRDIKPANVLVSTDGQVQLLDFGVAKLLEGDGTWPTDATALTQQGGRAMTPNYASPEQVAGRPLGVASDVYTLGVLLYELLTGTLPYRLPRRSAAALEEAILQAQVLRPSQAVPATDRRTVRALRGDLDTIVMKALQAAPDQRYASAAAMADDLQRHLAHQPITARPPRLAYRLRKLWQRQRLAVLASGALVLALAAGVLGTAWQAQRAQDEARRSRAVQQFLVRLLQTTDPQQGQARELGASALLALSAGRVDAEFAGQPDVQARLLHTLANIYSARGEPDKGLPLIDRAIALHAQAGRLDPDEPVQALVDRAELLGTTTDHPALHAALQAAEQAAQARGGPQHRWRGTLRANAAWLAMSEGRLDDAVALADEARRLMPRDSAAWRAAADTLATVYMSAGRLAQAREVLQQVQQDRRAPGAGTDAMSALWSRYNLARVRFILGEQAQAQPELQALLPEAVRVAGPQHELVLVARGLLAQVLAEQGEPEAGVAQARQAWADAKARGLPGDDQPLFQQATLARLLRLAGHTDEALPLARDALAQAEQRYAQPNRSRESVRRVLAEVLLAAGRADEGVAVLRQTLAHMAAPAMGSASLGLPQGRLMLAVAVRGTPAAAAADLEPAQVCAELARQVGDGTPSMLRCQALQAWLEGLALPVAQRGPAASRLAQVRAALTEAGLHPRHPLHAELMAAQAELLADDPAQAAAAAALRAQADARYRQALGLPLPARLLIVH